MECEKKQIRSLGLAKHQKLHLALLITCCVVSLIFLMRYSLTLPRLSSWLWSHVAPDDKVAGEMINTHELGGDARKHELKQDRKPLCDFSDRRSIVCELEGDIRVHGNSSSILFSNWKYSELQESWLIKPHARKEDPVALSHVTQVSVQSFADQDRVPRCAIRSSVPAIIFSTGGYMGNPFHDFTDVLIPLFITSFQFNGEVQFLVREIVPWWIQKYEPLLKRLSHYEIINWNQDNVTRCFPHVTVGLKFHKEMSIDPTRTPNRLSMVDFGRFASSSFAVPRESVIKLGEANQDKKPRLLIIARRRTRTFKNVDEIVQVAEDLGYEVIVADTGRDSNLTEFAQLVNSCDVMMGVHGAGLTNFIFLPVNATLIQVVPLGQMDEISRVDFGEPALDMKVNYLHYSITDEESTLMEQYPRDHPIFRDPTSITKQGWHSRRFVYLVDQDVKLNVVRFRAFLIRALQFLLQG
ncbi:hypothetical protein Cni_G12555 [Canna indica]|uniref:Glycosyltransferase 61 catalytic domain-containing protein n=1 Tax=Canna indica TaxID=4628 RepID=A0AAQ3K8J4_9LILI|nr:hypothetical protein Cni_G12555 [Canna indica]